MLIKYRRVRLRIYRGHQKSCIHHGTGRSRDSCRCTWWVDGVIDRKRWNKSLRTRNRDVALDIVREMEVTGEVIEQPPTAELVTLSVACEKFLADSSARGLREATLYKYRLLFRRLRNFAERSRILLIRDVSVDALRQFRATLPHRGTSANKRLEELRAFGRFCWESGWILENPAGRLKPRKTQDPPREPFSEEEVKRILVAFSQYPRRGNTDIERLRTLVHLLLESGLRLGDAVQLRRDSIVNGRLCLRTEKTGTSVCLPLSGCLLEELQMVKRTSTEYFFWSGRGKLKSCVGDWQRSLKRLFRLAGLPNGCAHRFRHTFAKRYLLAGIPPERVAILMGHSSLTVTLRHYARWVRERQEQLEADVRLVQEKYARYSLDGGTLVQQIQ